jgi:hypothetical protein
VWCFPIIAPLKRLFANPREAKLMRWHEDGRNKDEMLRHPIDAVQLINIDRKYYKTLAMNQEM